ncbi:MAG: hypothetical protein JWN23_423 [Rhodocyclales bacterium]|nr:hypothetical protein [Rhodocyclales bacterium]
MRYCKLPDGVKPCSFTDPIFMTVAVWGTSFLELFLEYALPSYLAQGGIPELPRRGYKSTFWLYTKSADAETIRQHAQFRRLCCVTVAEIVCIDEQTDISSHSTVYETMNACHLDFIARASRAGAAMIFFSPDALWSRDSLRYTLDKAESGQRAILLAGLRANKEAVVEALEPHKLRITSEGLGARELVSLLLQHPHRITQALNWNSDEFDIGWASHLYWHVGSEGIVGRCFHLHTFYVHPRLEARPELAHDYDWLAKIGLWPKEISVVSDSDNIFALELSPTERGINGRIGVRTLPVLADWVRRYAALDHRQYARKAICFHTGKASGMAWGIRKLISGLTIQSLLLFSALLASLGLELGSDNRWAANRSRGGVLRIFFLWWLNRRGGARL